jgi:hypothetical protein
MKKIIKLTESDLTRIIKKIINEIDSGDGQRDDFSEYEGREDIYVDSKIENPKNDENQTIQQVTEYFIHKISKKKIIKESLSSVNPWPLVKTYKYYNNLGSHGTFEKVFAPEIAANKEPFSKFENGCATKVSLALNAAGYKVKPAFRTTSATDLNPKGTPVQTSATSLKNQLGKPDLHITGKKTEEELLNEIGEGKTGVIICSPCGFSSATGHATIWSRIKGTKKKGGTVDESTYHLNNPNADIYFWEVG